MMTWKEKLHKTFSWTEYKADRRSAKELSSGKFLCADCYTKMLERNTAHKWNLYRYTTIAAFAALIWTLARWII